MRSNGTLWFGLTLLAAGATYVGVRFFGPGALRAQALEVALIGAVFVYLVRYVRLVPPADRFSRSRATLTTRARMILLALFGVGTLSALGFAVKQGLEGYTDLEPAALLTAPSVPPAGFYRAAGRPQLEALYRLGGPDGDRYMVPLDSFEGRLLIIMDDTPPATPVRVTGKLTRDMRTVQTSAEGQTEGPFLPLYREHMRLPPNTVVTFLDTGVRAGLNLPSVLMVLVPAYLFLLTLGAATRQVGPKMVVERPRSPLADRRGNAADAASRSRQRKPRRRG